MNLKFRLLVITIVALAFGLVGCGGGGGGGSNTPVQNLLLSRIQSWSNAMKSGNLNSTMSNFSRDYYDSGSDYNDMRNLMDDFYREGGRAWLEDLRGFEYVVDGNLAARRFVATFAVRIYGSTDYTTLDTFEYFRLENGKWLIYGNQSSRSRSNREGSDDPTIVTQMREQMKKQMKNTSSPPPAP